ncbi:hypothetical protein [Croceicoccus sp. Ery5]|uniref:hypothetical protein n=1 Tax=Croceicoccus sp. Ery5 TaxID=1703340 RepID=UPI001E2C1E5F|nr:hypothetical protein [Croceicoccus sp. Ery5]
MQERYLGDSHDFIKYSLLGFIHARLGLRLGVSWYLARTENVDRPGNNDGEKRHHLKGNVWRAADPDLFDKIRGFENLSERRLRRVADWGILPAGTLYHSNEICSAVRSDWHKGGVASLSESEIVFLDPDNGFEVPSMTKRTSAKYALYDEAADYFRAGKAVISIQFARQCDPIARVV